ncbi:MAG: molybdenum cofactor guanylyltransferase [Sarcina sp.]
MKSNITAVILSGGKNSRMAYKTKAFLSLDNKRFIDKILESLVGFEEIIISCNDFILYEEFTNRCRLVKDKNKEIGPIGGIRVALEESESEKIFVVAADMPFVEKEVIDLICSVSGKYDAIVSTLDGKLNPLFAIYNKSILPKLYQNIEDENYRLMSLIKASNFTSFAVEDHKCLENINTVEEYENLIFDRK